ncbi:tripartite tricarboxylate transporter substrate-binding protein [Nocardioides flavescens]|uniref:Tripartite tricarboxylate transporter substrate binding protein BugD n=1 Tax=Nocardioides flavescens TaxID=2691959 RepID=A0A6L7ESA4_9ACTN|nr:tripartite tricarboxylate transporter substrate-binding protein [Nocardioides flavescens]MXG90203.1 tripartite tricarboxylate transporter substrate binding protein BugD [Nocardioides flavescens]
MTASRPARSTSARRIAATVGVAAFALASTACAPGGGGDDAAASDSYPDRNIEVVVPFAAGGPTDTVTRLVGDPMSQELGVQMIVQNVEGAGGTVGAGEVANAKNDGYTLLMHHIGMSTAPTLYEDLAYDPVEDFEPIGLVTEVPMTIIARGDLEPKSLEELFAYLEENAGDVTLANAGVGSASHLCGRLIQQELGIELQEVPYDGAAPAIADLVGGQVDVMCDQTTNTTGQIEGGDVQAYAVTTPERVESLPDLPTTAEAGFPGVEVAVWHALYAPAGTPDAVVEKLRGSLATALEDQAVIDQMASLGTAPVAAEDVQPEAVTTTLNEQIDLWGDVLS